MNFGSTPEAVARHHSRPGSHARRLVALVILCTLLAACTPAAPAPTPPAIGPTPTVTVPADLPVVVTIGGPFRTPDLAAFDQVIATFEAANPDVWVEVANVRGNSEQRHERIAASLGEGDAGVDLYVIDDAWLAGFAANGWLLPLDDYVKSNSVDVGGLGPGAVQAATIGGQLVALPWRASGQSLAISAYSQAPDQAFRLAAFLAGYDP